MKFIFALIFSVGLTFSVFAAEDFKPLAKDFTATSLDGRVINLKEQRGKVVVLTFWSTTCPICASELPKLSKVVDRNAGKDVVFLALTMEHESRVSAYLKKRPFSSIIIPNSLGIFMDYSGKDQNGNYNMGFPGYFVINQSGEIELNTSGRHKTDDIDKKVKRLLSN